jgi:serine/threonine protein phosphatase PrpC
MYLPPATDFETLIDSVVSTIERVNGELHQMAEARQRSGVIGSTVVALLVHESGQAVCLWAGDSRLYRLRDAVLEQLTDDHSEAGEASEASGHAPRSNVITRAIGGRDGLELDQLSFDVRLGDRFLLCSDGLYRDIQPARIGELLQHGDAATTVETLIEHALRGEAADNITVVVVDAQPSTA